MEYLDKATQTGEHPIEEPQTKPYREAKGTREIVVMEYEKTPPRPTQRTGVGLVDVVNRALDELFFGKEGAEQLAVRQIVVRSPHVKTVSAPEGDECDGNTDFLAFLRGLCAFPIREELPPLPTVAPSGRFVHMDPFSREVLGHFVKDAPETSLPYMHFHKTIPAYRLCPLEEDPSQILRFPI